MLMKLFIISNRLPIKIIKDGPDDFHFVKSEGGLATGLTSIDIPGIEKHWIGWPGMEVADIKTRNRLKKELNESNFHPIFLSQKQINQYYEGYSNSILWPFFHYFYSFIEYDNRYWDAYKEVNKLFFEESRKIIEPGSIVWVHDYHLMLLPKLLRDGINNIKIGYFHHVPFPSYEFFRVLPERAELLNGLLGADLVGFHTFDYMRHFVSAVYRVLKVKFQLDHVFIGHHKCYANAFPMGIDYDLYHDAALKPEVQERVKVLKNNYGKDNKLILSVDRLDYSKGIIHRIKGFYLFLKNHPEFHGKVSLVMIIVPSRDTVNKYAKLKKLIDEKIGAINGKYSNINWTPVYYFYHSFDFDDLVAMYSMADIALVTPLRDGMNLVSKEYVAVKGDHPGVLILSEMTGAAAELQSALLINPNDIKQIENAIFQALTMPYSEQMERMEKMQAILSKHTVKKWASDFVGNLLEVCDKNKTLNQKELNTQNSRRICSSFKDGFHRLLVFDYDGTLIGFKDDPDDAYPNEEILDFLRRLASDDCNRVVITSGRDRSTMEKWFGNLNIGLAAEHGAAFKEDGVWQELIAPIDWDDEIVSILKEFVDKTPGSHLETKKTALVWHFRCVDDWLAVIREQQLINVLMSPCNRHGLQLMRGNKILEIKSPVYSKAIELKRLLKNGKYDFMLAIGDDVTDEDMFMAMPNNAFSIKVGMMSDTAKYNIPLQADVLPILRTICNMNS